MMKKEKNTNNLQNHKSPILNPKSNPLHSKSILVTGGAGFIGSNFIHYIFREAKFDGKIINVDKLTYAGNLDNLLNIKNEYEGNRYFFEKEDICDFDRIKNIFQKYGIDTVVNFAAESHVDRSIFGPKAFIQTNIMGTFNLLEVARECWKENNKDEYLFHHISTDEVYGSIENGNCFYEDTSYKPNSPYSASKASSDHLVRAYYRTYGLPITISNCSNNYGPYQFPEKLIPLMILNILEEKPLPVYGDGKNIRDWLYVEDHCSAIWQILNHGQTGETYNIGGDNEWENIKLVNVLCEKIGELHDKGKNYYKKLITFVKDRPGHDRRYAINCDKIKRDLGWRQKFGFEKGLDSTIKWYMNHQGWVDRVRSGEYRKWIEKNYEAR
jgi:dTDP-glucose 4,6-dehydratase